MKMHRNIGGKKDGIFEVLLNKVANLALYKYIVYIIQINNFI